MQMRPLLSPVPAWMPILLGSGLLWLSPGRVSSTPRIHKHKTRTQHSWGHSLSTSGARLLPPQPDKSPRDTQKKRQGPSVRGAQFQTAPPISALLQATPASCYYPAPTGLGQRGGKKMRGRRVKGEKSKEAERERLEERKRWEEERDI